MPAASGGQLTTWRTSPYSVWCDVYLHAPATVFQARVNMATVSYPLLFLTFDTVTTGAYTDIQAEQLLLLGTAAGLDDLGRIRIRANEIGGTVVATSSIVHIGRCSRGTRDGELDVADNAYITVLDLRQIWATPPRIDVTTDPDNPVTYKDGNIAFSIGDEFKPIVNFGSDRIAVVAGAGDTADFAFNATPSIVTDPDATSSKTYLYSISGGSVQAGNVNTATVTVRYGVGARYVKCRVTDSNGTYEDSWRLVVVTYPGDPHLLERVELRRSERPDGQTVSLDVDDEIPYSTYPDGTEVLVVQHERYGGTSGSLVGEGLIYQGWIQSENASVEARKTGLRRATQLQLADAAGRLKSLPSFPFVVNRVNGNGASWQDMRKLDLDLYGYHLIKWHSNALRRVDYLWSGIGDTYPVSTLGSDGQTLWGQMQFVANALRHTTTCDPTNRLAVKGDPNIQPTATQASTYSLPVARTSTVIVTIGEGDWKNYRVTYARPPRTHWNWGSAIVASTDEPDDNHEIGTVFCVAPGIAPGQGEAEQTSGQQVVNASTPQQELEVVEGNRYAARMNARYGNVTFDVRAGDIGISPALMEWVGLTVTAATAAQRGRTLSGNFLPLEITYDYDGRRGTCKKTIAFEQEVIGTPAEIDVRPTDTVGTYPPILPPSTPPKPTVTVPPYDGALPTRGLVFSAVEGKVAQITGLTGAGLTFGPNFGGVSNTKFYAAYSNPFQYKQAYGLGDVGLETSTDVSTNTAFSLLQTNASLFGSGQIGHRIRGSIHRNGYGAAVSGANYFVSTLDGWATLQSAVSINGNALDPDDGSAINVRADFCLCGHNAGHIYATAWTGGLAALYRSTDWGATWTLVYTSVFAYADCGRVWLDVPHMRRDGTPNVDDASIEIYLFVGGISGGGCGDIFIELIIGTASFTSSGTPESLNTNALNNNPMTTFTYSGNQFYFIDRIGDVRHMDDFTLGIMTGSLINITAAVLSVNGWSPNPLPAIVWSRAGSVYVTTDGVTFVNGLPAGWAAGIAYSELSLWTLQ